MMKPTPIRGLFASVASAIFISTILLTGCSGLMAEAGVSTLPDTGSAPTYSAKGMNKGMMTERATKPHLTFPAAEMEQKMKAEGWEPVLYGAALDTKQQNKSTFSLFRQKETGDWRILHVSGGKARVAFEGSDLTLSEPKNPRMKQASFDEAFNSEAQAILVHHPESGLFNCGPNLAGGEAKKAGMSTVAEGITQDGQERMTIMMLFPDGTESKIGPTWVMYIEGADNPGVQCRIETGYGMRLAEGFDQKPLGYNPDYNPS